MHIVKLQRLSNSLIVTVPRHALARLKWTRGDQLVAECGEHSITFRAIKQHIIGQDQKNRLHDDIPADSGKAAE